MVVISTLNFYEFEQAKNPSFGAFHHLNVEWSEPRTRPNLSQLKCQFKSFFNDSAELDECEPFELILYFSQKMDCEG